MNHVTPEQDILPLMSSVPLSVCNSYHQLLTSPATIFLEALYICSQIHVGSVATLATY